LRLSRPRWTVTSSNSLLEWQLPGHLEVAWSEAASRFSSH
jgi:hypothetical protein